MPLAGAISIPIASSLFLLILAEYPIVNNHQRDRNCNHTQNDPEKASSVLLQEKERKPQQFEQSRKMMKQMGGMMGGKGGRKRGGFNLGGMGGMNGFGGRGGRR